MRGARPRVRRAAARARGSLHVDLNRDYRRSVFLAGSGRSGTTWLSEIVNHRNDYRYVFEPFYPDRVRICKDFRRKQYLRPDDRREEYLGPARDILSGRVRSLWTDRYNRKLLVRRRLIKDIRANLLLGWLQANFPGMPVVFLLRHPCAVTASRLRLGWQDVLDDTMEQGDLVEDFLRPFEAEIRAARDPFERSVFLWCIENYVPLLQLGRGGTHVLLYEDLCLRPREEVRRLLAFLGEAADKNAHLALRRPSPLSRPDSAVVLGARPVESWTSLVSDAQVERTIEILSLFGLDHVYGESPVPKAGGVETFLKEQLAGKKAAGDGG